MCRNTRGIRKHFYMNITSNKWKSKVKAKQVPIIKPDALYTYIYTHIYIWPRKKIAEVLVSLKQHLKEESPYLYSAIYIFVDTDRTNTLCHIHKHTYTKRFRDYTEFTFQARILKKPYAGLLWNMWKKNCIRSEPAWLSLLIWCSREFFW